MKHKTGDSLNRFYTPDELDQIADYVDKSFAIRNVLAFGGNNTTPVLPNLEALKYILNT